MSTPITNHKVLIFDVYATLINWEAGIWVALQPLLSQFPASDRWSKDEALLAYASVEHELEVKHPGLLYADLLAKTYEVLEERLKAHCGIAAEDKSKFPPAPATLQTTSIVGKSTFANESEAALAKTPSEKFAESIRSWPIFPDTRDALRRLAKHFKLIVLSNVDRQSFGFTHAVLSEDPTLQPAAPLSLYTSPLLNSGEFWFPQREPRSKSPFSLIMTTQDTGVYKPELEGFLQVLEIVRTSPELLGGQGKDGADLTLDEVKDKVLMVAKSIFHDIEPATRLGMKGVWIERPGTGAATVTSEQKCWTWRYDTLGEFADAVEKEINSAA